MGADKPSDDQGLFNSIFRICRFEGFSSEKFGQNIPGIMTNKTAVSGNFDIHNILAATVYATRLADISLTNQIIEVC